MRIGLSAFAISTQTQDPTDLSLLQMKVNLNLPVRLPFRRSEGCNRGEQDRDGHDPCRGQSAGPRIARCQPRSTRIFNHHFQRLTAAAA